MMRLPTGIQNFREIREGDFYYVDKTQFAFNLATRGKYYFLSRPRRFGKSLFVDTLQELFEANEPLFRGLYVHDRWDWSTRHPVIKLSFNEGVLKSRAALDEKIQELLLDNQRRLQVSIESTGFTSLSGRFSELIRLAHEQYGQRVVILVDEYDKPILDNIADSAIALEMREGLKNIYSVIKGMDAHIRFAFLTGVSKFSKVSLFSGLNNLTDITLDPRYAAICGYTDVDVDTVFAPELPGLNRDEIRRWYNGYNWLGEGVYNPFDLLQLFDQRKFRPYWFETATPTFLIELLARRGEYVPDLARLEADLELISTFDVDNIPTVALMFQTGYLTIDQEKYLDEESYYQLRYPNEEVLRSLHKALLPALTHHERQLPQRKRLHELLKQPDFPALRTLFQSFYDNIPYDWYTNNPIAQYEGYYCSVFYSYFAALGLNIIPEDTSNQGRVDMTVDFGGYFYLFEFKVVELTPEGKAMKQLKTKNYAAKYLGQGKPIYLIGVEFSKEKRNIVGFDVEAV